MPASPARAATSVLVAALVAAAALLSLTPDRYHAAVAAGSTVAAAAAGTPVRSLLAAATEAEGQDVAPERVDEPAVGGTVLRGAAVTPSRTSPPPDAVVARPVRAAADGLPAP